MHHSTTVRIEGEIYKTLVKLAKKEERSINKIINILLREAIQKRGVK